MTVQELLPRTPADVLALDLSDEDARQIGAMLDQAERQCSSVNDLEFYLTLPHLTRLLPPRLLDFMEGFRLAESAAGIVIRGLAIDDVAIGPTPSHWRECADAANFRQDACLVIVASLLGDVFGWTTLQNGRLVQNVLPIKGEEMEQSGHGSRTNLEWHTEDGFHPYRCDYLGFLGMRNIDLVPTTFASVRPVSLSDEVLRTLFEPRFLIRPDNEHLRNAAVARTAASGVCVKSIGTEPEPVPVLFGDPGRPYLRIDPYFMDHLPGDGGAARALKEVIECLDEALDDLVVGAGDLAFVDNYLAVHGRRPFQARYDGTDRWLKKVTVSRDLRRSRELRDAASSRVLS